MKITLQKLLLGTLILSASFGILSFTMSSDQKPKKTKTEECSTCRFDQCHAIAKSTGVRCRHCVSNYGDLYCYQHK